MASALLVAVVLACLGARAGGDLPDSQPCPEACACRYSRIFWETDCAARGLVEFPEGLSVDAYSLDVSNNRLQRLGPFPAGCRLRRLAARACALQQLHVDDLAQLDLLVEVDLAQNLLMAVDPATFRNASGLLTLSLANNQLETPSGPLLASDSLKNLDLHGNRLRALPGGAFANCSSLATLDLSDNPLEALPAAGLAPLTGLETLAVARCGLDALDPAALAPLTQLKQLDASGNMLGAWERWAPALHPLARLEALALEAAALEGPLPAHALAGCASLRRLQLSSNPALRDPWRPVAALDDITELEVRDCGLTELAPRELRANMSALRMLDASDNPTLGAALRPGALALPALETLRLARCGLAQPPPHAAYKDAGGEEAAAPAEDVWVGPLEVLSLAGNALIAPLASPLLPAAAQGTLRTLDLSNCSLRALPPAALRGAANLSELSLTDNPLQEMGEEALRELPSLTTLDLRDCRLRALRPQQLAHTPRLRTLRLTGNPWPCADRCALRRLWAWAEHGKGDLGVLEGAANLTCLEAPADAPADAAPRRRLWKDVVEAEAADDAECPLDSWATSKAVRRRAAPPSTLLLLSPASGPGPAQGRRPGLGLWLGPALLALTAAALTAVLAALAVRIGASARLRRRSKPRQAAP